MNRRLMMQQPEALEEIPRERIVFSKAGDIIADGVTKTYNGEVICGFAVIHQNRYGAGYKPYWLYLVLMTKSGQNYNAVVASKWARNLWINLTLSDGLLHTLSCTTHQCNLFDSVESGIEFIKTININNLPILNEITGKLYEAQSIATADGFYSTEVAQDLLDYYYGVI